MQYSLCNLGKIVTGKTPKTEDKNNFGEKYMFVTPSDMVNNFKMDKTERFLSEKGLNSVFNNSINGISVLVDCIGSNLGNVAIVNKKCVTNQQINSITEFKPFVNPYYVFFWLSQKKSLLQKRAGGTSVPIINKTQFSNIKINLPAKEIQDKIVKNILILQEKEHINSQIASCTEEYIKLLFYKWFVNFNFLKNDRKPYKVNGVELIEKNGKIIPKDWKTEYLGKGNLSKLLSPGIEKYNGLKKYVTTSNVNFLDIDNDLEETTFVDRTSRANMQPEIHSVWFAKMKDSIKHVFVLDQDVVDNYIFSTGFAGLQCSEKSFPYVASFINSNYFERKKDKLSNGSTQKAINNTGIKNIKIVVPTEEILEKYYEKTYPLFKKIDSLRKQNETLKETRDLMIKKMIK